MTGGRLRRLGTLGRVGTIVLLVSLVLWTPSAYSVPMTFVVTTTADDAGACDSSCSLREAITEANANADPDTIEFAIAGSGVQTIQPATPLPGISSPVTIDGTTQPGYSGTPLIELDGTNAGTSNGLIVMAADTTIKALVVNRFNQAGVYLGSTNGKLEASYVGTNAAGTAAAGNFNGVYVEVGGNTVGGTGDAATRNVISGNLNYGVDLNGAGVVTGNYIGLNAAGTAALGNTNAGIDVEGDGNTIGGTSDSARNVVSANGTFAGQAQIELRDGADGTTVHGNYVGTLPDGATEIASTTGILVGRVYNDLTRPGPSGTLIGGTASGAGNVIGGQSTAIIVQAEGTTDTTIQGNYIGTNPSDDDLGGAIGIQLYRSSGNTIGGVADGAGNTIANLSGTAIYVYSGATGNTIRGNSIDANGDIAIDLLPTGDTVVGVTPNDAGDADTGGNNLQNFPVLNPDISSTTEVAGDLHSTPSQSFTIDVYASESCDPTGNGEGATHVASFLRTTDGSGDASFSEEPLDAGASGFLTATATDDSGNTSEFSACVDVGGGGGGGTAHEVNTTDDDDDGTCDATHCSLREAIDASNTDSGDSTITFDLPGDIEINLLSELPEIEDTVTIDGTTQLPAGYVVLDGSGIDVDANGLTLETGSEGSTLKGLRIEAVDLTGIRIISGGNIVQGNYLSSVENGISVEGAGATGNTLGGDHGAGEGNRIWDFSRDAIHVESTGAGNEIAGNTIGIDENDVPQTIQSGTNGIFAAETADLVIGDDVLPDEIASIDPNRANVIVRASTGIFFESDVTGAVVAGNRIGTDRTGDATNLGNEFTAFDISSSDTNQLGPGNIVAHTLGIVGNPTAGHGIRISNGQSNRIVANSIHDNALEGISLSSSNNDVSSPELTDASIFGGLTTISGEVSAGQTETLFIELFANATCDTGGSGEGETFLGFVSVDAEDGINPFTSPPIPGLSIGDVITATTTHSVTEGTSEFSNCVTVETGGGGDTVDPPVLFAAVPDATPNALGIAGLVEDDALPADSSFQVQFYSSPQCNSASPTALGTRTVTTNANGVAAFALEGFPNVADGTAVRATASRGGPPSEFSNCVIADPNNTSWPTALAMGATSTRAGYLRDQGQARWFKVPIVPNSHVDLRLSGLPGDYDMVVFGDIAAAYDELVGGAGYVPSAGPNLALDDLNRQGANAPADVFNTSQYNPSAWDPTNWDPTLNTANFSPSQWSPSQWSPSQWSASQWSPSQWSPSQWSPSQWSPSQWSPSQWSPSQWSPSQWSPSQWSSSNPADPSAFSTAQTSTVLAVSGNTGTGDENVSVNTWNNTGFLYVRVQGKNGIFDPDDEFTLDVSRTGNPCSGVVDQPSSPTAPATNRRTLILVDGSRMSIGGTLAGKLNQLSARPEVQGAVVNVASDPVVASLNAQADAKKACPYAKNLVASAITRIVNAYRATNPLEYVVVVGDDSVIPFYRYPDPALLGNEKLYVPPVRDDTASQASLRLGFVLNQDGYGSSDTVSLHGNAFPVPDLAVGRLVETPAEVEGMLDAYLGTAGGVVPTPTSSLTTGYDFLQDAADVIAGHLSAGIRGSNNATLITNRTVSPETVTVGTSPDRNHSWTGADLRRSLLNSGRHDLIFLAGHFSANDALGADYRTNVLSTELPASSTSFVNSIVFSAGCHTGYNIVNGDATTWTEPLDWAQAFARKRATLISGTGYQYGDTDFLAHSERIYAEFARQLRVTTGAGGAPVPVSVGRALLRSKQLFLETTPGLTALDEKALLQATLFGLPMLSVNLPQGRIVETPDTTVVSGITPVGPGPGAALGLGFADLGVGPSLTPQSLQLKSGPLATWLSGPDGVAVRPTQPILPLDGLNVTSPNPNQALRGVAFRGGTYTDALNVTPLTAASATELRGVHAPFFTDVFFPTQPWTVNFFGALGGGATRLHATPVQHRSNLGGDLTKSTRRQFSNLDLRLFYSGNTSSYCQGTSPLALAPCPGGLAVAPALAAPPTITGVETEFDTNTRELTFKAKVLGELVAGIQAAWVTWTVPPAAGQQGSWQSLDLEPDPDAPVLWTATMTLPVGLNPANVRFVVQAVNGVGRVKIDDNVGAFYQPGSIPGQQEPGAGAPAPTALTFTTAPPSSVAFGSSFTVVARLASGGSPVDAKLVRIGFGAAGVPDFTNGSGEASVSLGASVSPGTYVVTASFAGDAAHAPSDAVQTVQVTKRPTTLALTGTLLMSNPLTATLTADAVPGSASAALNQRNVFLVITGGPLTQVYSAKTDPKGRVQLPDSLLATLPPRIYTVDAYFNGATLPGSVQVDPDDVDYAHAEAHQTIDSWLGAAFTGFVGMSNPPAFNGAKAGTAVPIKFNLGANRGLSIFATGYPKVGTVPCNSPNASPTGLVVADSNGLKIDTKNNQYTWDWRTGSWKGTCRALIVRFADGTEKKLLFKF